MPSEITTAELDRLEEIDRFCGVDGYEMTLQESHEVLAVLPRLLAAAREAVTLRAEADEAKGRSAVLDQLNARLQARIDGLEAAARLSVRAHAEDTDGLRAELARLKAERQWRPISEAKKDGTDYLMFGRPRDVPLQYVGFFDEEYQCWLDRDLGPIEPTHFMHLPEAPE